MSGLSRRVIGPGAAAFLRPRQCGTNTNSVKNPVITPNAKLDSSHSLKTNGMDRLLSSAANIAATAPIAPGSRARAVSILSLNKRSPQPITTISPTTPVPKIIEKRELCGSLENSCPLGLVRTAKLCPKTGRSKKYPNNALHKPVLPRSVTICCSSLPGKKIDVQNVGSIAFIRKSLGQSTPR